MQSGQEQFRNWIERRFPNSPRKQRDAAEYFGWDETFIAKLLADPPQQRKPGLINAIVIERHTGIPVEAWVSTELDETERVGATERENRQ